MQLNIVVRVKNTSGNELPMYQTAGAAGCDIRSAEEDVILPGEKKIFMTGLSFEIPSGFECQIRPRSSLARNHGVIVFNSPSTIDSDFRGELGILLVNTSNKNFKVDVGDRIAQLVFAPVTRAAFETVTELSETIRGQGGWGSTGRQ